MTLWHVSVQRPTVETTRVVCVAPDAESAAREALRMIENDDCDTPYGQARWDTVEANNSELTIVEVRQV